MKNDPVFAIIKQEQVRQSEGLELIPSENYVSAEVLKAMGSVLTNKYSEGYPGKRYYGGNENIDQIENLAIERAKELFHATTLMCSRTLVPMLMRRFTLPGVSRVIRFLPWRFRPADISRTALR